MFLYYNSHKIILIMTILVETNIVKGDTMYNNNVIVDNKEYIRVHTTENDCNRCVLCKDGKCAYATPCKYCGGYFVSPDGVIQWPNTDFIIDQLSTNKDMLEYAKHLYLMKFADKLDLDEVYECYWCGSDGLTLMLNGHKYSFDYIVHKCNMD